VPNPDDLMHFQLVITPGEVGACCLFYYNIMF
jgi:hypothetical protein